MNYGAQLVGRVLDELGISIDSESKGWGLGFCPLHDNKHTPALVIHLEQGAWRCMAGCGRSPDLAVLLAQAQDRDARDVRRDLLQGLASDPDSLETALADRNHEPTEAQWQEPLFYERGRTSKYMLRRGFTLETLARWEIGWDPETQSDVIPVRFQGELVGLIRRPHSGKPAKYVTSWGFVKSDYLLGWDLIDSERCVTVVEGPLDAAWLDQHGRRAVALMGSSISDQQADLLARRFERVTLALDADNPGRVGTLEALRHPFLRRLWVDVLPIPAGHKDVGDCSLEELDMAYDCRSAWGFT